jgi:hypothetical protein
MKLTSVLVERTLSQFEARVIPDGHPVVPQLNRLFGDHTFFLDGNGLNIVEPVETASGMSQAAKVVNLANWQDSDRQSLTPHEPQETDVVVELGPPKPDAH